MLIVLGAHASFGLIGPEEEAVTASSSFSAIVSQSPGELVQPGVSCGKFLIAPGGLENSERHEDAANRQQRWNRLRELDSVLSHPLIFSYEAKSLFIDRMATQQLFEFLDEGA